jgi:hypothetical protein
VPEVLSAILLMVVAMIPVMILSAFLMVILTMILLMLVMTQASLTVNRLTPIHPRLSAHH